MNSLLTNTVARPNRKWIVYIFAIAVVTSSREPALGNKGIWIFEVGRVVVGSVVGDSDFSL